MSETGSEPGETAPAATHPAGRAEIIRRSLEGMNEDNVRRVRNVYVPPGASPEPNGTASADEPEPADTPAEESTG